MKETSIEEYSLVTTFLLGNILTVEFPIREILATDIEDAKKQAIAFYLNRKMGKVVYNLKQDKMIYIDAYNSARLILQQVDLSLNTIEEENYNDITYYEWKNRLLEALGEEVSSDTFKSEIINFRIEPVIEY